MNVENWTKVKNELLGENDEMFIISSENVTVSKFEINKLIDLPAHSHINEQVTIIVVGEMIIKYGTIEKKMCEGDVCIIPANMLHSAQILKIPFKSFDIFHPIREDFLQKIK